MISAESFISEASTSGFRLFSGVPCSYLTPFINYVSDSAALRYIGAVNEGDAVAIAAGAELGGMRSMVILQNSGLGNALNPLTSLTWPFRIPLLLVTTLRAQPGGPRDEPQHRLMGAITTSLLELMEIPWEYFPDQEDQISSSLARAVRHMDEHRRPYAMVMKKGTVAPWQLRSKGVPKTVESGAVQRASARYSRTDMLAAARGATSDADVLIATTGYTGRELFALGDGANQLYMVGSMGCAAGLGLGLAVAQPDRRIVVFDGDGAALMRLGAQATLGFERPANLTHVLLDNGMHESTGGQSTVSQSLDFCAIAAGCGYPKVSRASSPEELARFISDPGETLHFIHVPILPGVPEDLPRPTIQPPEVAARLRSLLAESS